MSDAGSNHLLELNTHEISDYDYYDYVHERLAASMLFSTRIRWVPSQEGNDVNG